MSNTLRRSLSLCLAALAFYAHSLRAVAAPGEAPPPAGGLSAFGRVLLDGAEAVSGVTFFSGSEVRTGEDSRAVLALGDLGRAEVLPQSAVQVGFGGGDVSASLASGGMRLSKPEGVAAAVATPGGGSVVSERGAAAVFAVSYGGGRTTVETYSGRVILRSGGREIPVGAGERYAEGTDPQDSDDGMSDRKKAGIILGVGGAIALLLIILATTGDDENPVIPPPISPSQ